MIGHARAGIGRVAEVVYPATLAALWLMPRIFPVFGQRLNRLREKMLNRSPRWAKGLILVMSLESIRYRIQNDSFLIEGD